MDIDINIQNLLPGNPHVCFVIPALFSTRECEQLLTHEIKASFQNANSNYPTYYRNNERLVVDDEGLASRLFLKVKPWLPEKIEANSGIQSENGLWHLAELNSRLRFCKYSANQYFHRHLDGIHYQSETKQSKLTFMIYLNDASEFEGGRTLFYKTKESQEIWAAYTPRIGDLIVFDHNVWHEGEVLDSGEKFVLRSDIIYERAHTPTNNLPFSGHLGYIWKVLVFDNETILSGGRDNSINVWNKNGRLIQQLTAHENSILCLEKINEQLFVSGSRDKQIKVWERRSDGFNLLRSICFPTSVVLTLCNLHKGLFAAAGGDNVITISDLQGIVKQKLNEHTNWVWQVLRLDAYHIASCSEDGTIKIWDYRVPQSIATFRDECSVISILYNPISQELISGNLTGELTIRRLGNDFKVIDAKKIKAHDGLVRTLIKLSDTSIASGGEDCKIKVWDTNTHKSLAEFQHRNFVQSLELLPDDILLSASYDGTIKAWEYLR